MNDINNTPPATGTTDQSTNSRLISNETTMKAGDRTGTQKLTISSLEKHDSSSANLWWRNFVQNIKMTKDIEFSNMTNSTQVSPQYRNQVELEIKDTFLCAIGQSALTEVTKTD